MSDDHDAAASRAFWAQFRRGLGVSSRQAARELGVHRRTIGRVETERKEKAHVRYLNVVILPRLRVRTDQILADVARVEAQPVLDVDAFSDLFEELDSYFGDYLYEGSHW